MLIYFSANQLPGIRLSCLMSRIFEGNCWLVDVLVLDILRSGVSRNVIKKKKSLMRKIKMCCQRKEWYFLMYCSGFMYLYLCSSASLHIINLCICVDIRIWAMSYITFDLTSSEYIFIQGVIPLRYDIHARSSVLDLISVCLSYSFSPPSLPLRLPGISPSPLFQL